MADGAGAEFDPVFRMNVGWFVRYIQSYSDRPYAPALRIRFPSRADACTNVAFEVDRSRAAPGQDERRRRAPPVPVQVGAAARPPRRWTGVLPSGIGRLPCGRRGDEFPRTGRRPVGRAGCAEPGRRRRTHRPHLAPAARALRHDARRRRPARHQAVGRQGHQPHAAGHAGTVRAAEMSGSLLGVRTPDERGTLYFTNHCHTPGLRDLPRRHDYDNSMRRWAYLERHLAGENETEHSWDGMRALIGSHHPSRPGDNDTVRGAICQHGPEMFTNLALVIAPRSRTLWVARWTVLHHAVRRAAPRAGRGGPGWPLAPLPFVGWPPPEAGDHLFWRRSAATRTRSFRTAPTGTVSSRPPCSWRRSIRRRGATPQTTHAPIPSSSARIARSTPRAGAPPTGPTHTRRAWRSLRSDRR